MARARCCGRLAACAGLLLSRPALLVLLVVTAQQATPAAAASAQAGVLVPLAATAQLPPLDEHCSSEAQVVHCGQLSLFDAGRQECCEAFRPSPSPVASSPFVGWGVVSGVARPDLEELAAAAANASSSTRASAPDWGNCMQTAVVDVPLFGSAADRSVAVVQQSVPLLSRDAIAAVKAAALAKLAPPLREQVANLTRVHNVSGFVHPAGIVGPAEMVLLKQRLADGTKQQQVALESLLTGEGVQPKVYPGGWSVPTDTPETWQGPYVLSVVDAKWSGFNTGRVVCPANYPAGAPTAICAHTSFVELDAQQAYKQALASWATGDARYAANVFRIIDGWATNNTAWGDLHQNGPLEAGWGCAALARALELVRDAAPPGLLAKFTAWMDGVLMPQMDYYVSNFTHAAVAAGTPHLYGNWHSTIAECFVTVGLLTDNRARYEAGLALYHATVADYLKWGRGSAGDGRIVGECSETLRDIYHSEFGLGGLLQVAELAWQQGEDVYSSGGHALAAAMELHARIIRAGTAALARGSPNAENVTLPAGFDVLANMPPPPAGCVWSFNLRTQLWSAFNATTREWVADLRDGVKYLVAAHSFLPTGWELGLNHFAGRLAMRMPETVALLQRRWPTSYEFHWGLDTLTHAATANELWRAGLQPDVVCGAQARPSASGGRGHGQQ